MKLYGVQVLKITRVISFETSIIPHNSMLEELCWLLLFMTWCAEKSGFSRLQIVLATKLLAPWNSLPSIHPWPFPQSRAVERRWLMQASCLFLASGKQRFTVITYGVPSHLSFKWYNPLFIKTPLKLRTPSKRHKQTLPRRNARHPSRNGQARRRSKHPPESNTRFCLNIVCMPFL